MHAAFDGIVGRASARLVVAAVVGDDALRQQPIQHHGIPRLVSWSGSTETGGDGCADSLLLLVHHLPLAIRADHVVAAHTRPELLRIGVILVPERGILPAARAPRVAPRPPGTA